MPLLADRQLIFRWIHEGFTQQQSVSGHCRYSFLPIRSYKGNIFGYMPIIRNMIIAYRAVLIKKACGIESGSGSPKANKVATIKKAQIEEIAKLKMKDLNAANIETATKMIAGTARSMGVKVEE